MVSPKAMLATAKGRLMRCTVQAATPNCLAMTRTPARPRATSASRIRFSSVGAIEGGARGVYPHPWPGTDSYRNHPPVALGNNAYDLKQQSVKQRLADGRLRIE